MRHDATVRRAFPIVSAMVLAAHPASAHPFVLASSAWVSLTDGLHKADSGGWTTVILYDAMPWDIDTGRFAGSQEDLDVLLLAHPELAEFARRVPIGAQEEELDLSFGAWDSDTFRAIEFRNGCEWIPLECDENVDSMDDVANRRFWSSSEIPMDRSPESRPDDPKGPSLQFYGSLDLQERWRVRQSYRAYRPLPIGQRIAVRTSGNGRSSAPSYYAIEFRTPLTVWISAAPSVTLPPDSSLIIRYRPLTKEPHTNRAEQ